jgi:hypothetical protein
MILVTYEGRSYSFTEISEMLSDIGFVDTERRP